MEKTETAALCAEAEKAYFDLNPGYQEILRLRDMLTEAGIPFGMQRMRDGWAIFYHGHGDNIISDAIEHRGSYGHEDDRLEIIGLTQMEDEIVEGWLTAREVFARWKAHWDKEDENHETEQGKKRH